MDSSTEIPYKDYKDYKDINDVIKEHILIDGSFDYEQTDFKCINQNLTSLKGIEKLPNLTRLICYGNHLKNLDDLKYNTKLEVLNCNENTLICIKGLNNLTNIKKLGVAANYQLNNFTGIESLTNLIEFNYQYTKCYLKYKELSNQDIVKHVFTELHLNKEDEYRGHAALLHSGLF